MLWIWDCQSSPGELDTQLPLKFNGTPLGCFENPSSSNHQLKSAWDTSLFDSLTVVQLSMTVLCDNELGWRHLIIYLATAASGLPWTQLKQKANTHTVVQCLAHARHGAGSSAAQLKQHSNFQEATCVWPSLVNERIAKYLINTQVSKSRAYSSSLAPISQEPSEHFSSYGLSPGGSLQISFDLCPLFLSFLPFCFSTAVNAILGRSDTAWHHCPSVHLFEDWVASRRYIGLPQSQPALKHPS